MEAVGKIFKIMPEQSGTSARGTWMKQEFVIETEEQFPRKVCFSMWGEDKCAGLKQLALGDKVVVSFNAESREFNDRWYTDLRCWKLEKQTTQAVAGGNNFGGGNPQQNNYAPQAPVANAVVNEQVSDEFTPDDDLPF
ncbi:DUF3127 domain-containing protein [Bacteroidales bacterium OttesenSCG-928-C19]|nr:DUF3127 domain-containing protein [Bacteroidales bacterium OttesenSCG-928-C19]